MKDKLHKTAIRKRLEEKIIEFEKNIFYELGYSLCSKEVDGRKCDAGEGCIHLRNVMGIKLCWTK